MWRRMANRFIANSTYWLAKCKEANGRILMYHSVKEREAKREHAPRSTKPGRLSVSLEQFRCQMDWLKSDSYNVLTLREFYNHLAEERALLPKSVALTFDDGYIDNYLHAYPILQHYNFPATIFLIADYVGTQMRFAWDSDYEYGKSLDWAQIRELSRNGFDFGSHTCKHPLLSSIPIKQTQREIDGSKGIIEDKLGCAVEFFCYPAGNFRQVHRDMVEQAGYVGACSIKPGKNNSETDFYALKRTEISGDDTLKDFKQKLAGAYDLSHRIIQHFGN